MWVIANFIEENNVEVVPHCWIKGNECFWPLLPRDKMKKYIEKEIVPEESEIWKKYKIRIIGNKIYDDLQKARQKSNIALVRSDVETDVEAKRKVIKNKRYLDLDDNDSDDPGTSEDDCQKSSEKRNPNKKFKKALWISKKKVVSSPLKVPGDIPNVDLPRRSPRKLVTTPTSLKVPKYGNASKNDTPMPSPSTSWATKVNPGVSSDSKSSNFEDICIKNQSIIKNYLRQILQELTSMNNRLEQIQKQQVVAERVEEEEPGIIKNLPLKTLGEVFSLEEDLEDKTKEAELTNFLARIGGANMGDACRRILRSLLIDEVACLFSWAGQKGKRVFSSLRLRTPIFRAVLKQYPNGTDKEIEKTVKDWLRPSKNRLLSKEKSRKGEHGKDVEEEHDM